MSAVHAPFFASPTGSSLVKAGEAMQADFGFIDLAGLSAPKPAPAAMVAQVTSEAMAVTVSVKLCRAKAAWVAAKLNRSESWLSRIRHGSLRLPDALLAAFCTLTGTTLLAQYRALQDALTEAEGRMSEDRAAQLFAEKLRRCA